jgi:hypothetical protein
MLGELSSRAASGRSASTRLLQHASRAAPLSRARRAGRMSGAARASAVASTGQALKVYDAQRLDAAQLKALMARPRIDFTSILSTVRMTDCAY